MATMAVRQHGITDHRSHRTGHRTDRTARRFTAPRTDRTAPRPLATRCSPGTRWIICLPTMGPFTTTMRSFWSQATCGKSQRRDKRTVSFQTLMGTAANTVWEQTVFSLGCNGPVVAQNKNRLPPGRFCGNFRTATALKLLQKAAREQTVYIFGPQRPRCGPK